LPQASPEATPGVSPSHGDGKGQFSQVVFLYGKEPNTVTFSTEYAGIGNNDNDDNEDADNNEDDNDGEGNDDGKGNEDNEDGRDNEDNEDGAGFSTSQDARL
jgi:hypothetical protein